MSKSWDSLRELNLPKVVVIVFPRTKPSMSPLISGSVISTLVRLCIIKCLCPWVLFQFPAVPIEIDGLALSVPCIKIASAKSPKK